MITWAPSETTSRSSRSCRPRARISSISSQRTAGSTTTPLPITQALPGWRMPLGMRRRIVFSPFTTSVWPALLPPWYRTTTSACSVKRSTIFPLPSSPHWAPTTTTLDMGLAPFAQRAPSNTEGKKRQSGGGGSGPGRRHPGRRPSSGGEAVHDRGQRFHRLHGQGVVDGGADPAHGTVPLQSDLAGGLGLGEEALLRLLGRQAEGHVHAGAALPFRVPEEDVGPAVDDLVEHGRLFLRAPGHLRKAPLLLDPAEDEAAEPDAEGGRRVVQRSGLGVGLVTEDLRYRGRAGEILQDRASPNDDGHARWPGVFLRARVEETEFGDVQRPRQKIRAHVRHERNGRVRNVLPLRAIDRVVGGDVQIWRARRHLDPLVGARHAAVS